MREEEEELTSRRISDASGVLEYLLLPPEARAVLEKPAQRFVAAAAALGRSVHADVLRVDACHRLRLGQDAVFSAAADPVPGYARLLERAAACLEAQAGLPLAVDSPLEENDGQLIDLTTAHYGKLWGSFSPSHYFNEARALLRARFERNGVDTAWFKGRRALDCGCGGGRYTAALKSLGFAEVVGADGSEEAVGVARQRAEQAGLTGVSYVRTDVLKLPFKDGEFDFVFSNGVLHHTRDTLTGLRELARVMKPEGRGWVYLYARPGGLDRLTHYLARLILKHADREACRRYCASLGLSGSRTFFLLDLWLTPVAECYTPRETEDLLRAAGWRDVRRFDRGADQDLVEQLLGSGPFASIKYGAGENRYLVEGK